MSLACCFWPSVSFQEVKPTVTEVLCIYIARTKVKTSFSLWNLKSPLHVWTTRGCFRFTQSTSDCTKSRVKTADFRPLITFLVSKPTLRSPKVTETTFQVLTSTLQKSPQYDLNFASIFNFKFTRFKFRHFGLDIEGRKSVNSSEMSEPLSSRNHLVRP